MKSYRAGETVQYGIYVAPRSADIRTVGADGEILEGKTSSRYCRLPTVLAVAASPLIGGIFVLAFPVLVLVVVASAVAQVATRWVRAALAKNAHLVRVRWEPVASYLNKTQEPNEGDEASAEEETEAELLGLEAEVEARREAESHEDEQ